MSSALVPLRNRRAVATVGLAVLLVLAAMSGLRHFVGGRLLPLRTSGAALPVPSAPAAELVAGTDNALRVQPEVVRRMGIATAAARKAEVGIELTLAGTLTVDATRLQRVRSRFTGEVTEIGTHAQSGRPIQYGDTVAQGQLLAVVWSRELGEKKSELIDALSQMQLDVGTQQRLEKLFRDGAIPEHQYRDVVRAVETDRIAVSRLLRTLKTWRVSDAEIAPLEAEAARLAPGSQPPTVRPMDPWARVEVRAAFDGIVLERNVAVGDLVEPEDDLFKVADLSRFRVLAYAYEEDLPRLDALDATRRSWTITVPASRDLPPQTGEFEQIGRIIDPAQHTAMVMGWVDNVAGRLRAGQFITASVTLPSPGNETVLPESALIEKGGEKLVFVQTDPHPIFTLRRVSLSRRVGGMACFFIVPPTAEKEPKLLGIEPGEEVVTSGAVELQQALTDLLVDRARAPHRP